MRLFVLLAAVLLLPSTLHAQSGDATLKRLATQAAEYQRTLPSFNCEESVVSSVKSKGKLKRVEFQAEIRVARGPDGKLKETTLYTTNNGNAVKPGSQVKMPIKVDGGLSVGLPGAFQLETQACYRYTLSGSRIDFVAKAPAAGCETSGDTVGFATLDGDGNIVHGELRRGPQARKVEYATFAAVDYATVNLNGKDFRLPSHFYAEYQDGDWLGSFDAHYSNCRLFHATITLGPATVQPADVPR